MLYFFLQSVAGSTGIPQMSTKSVACGAKLGNLRESGNEKGIKLRYVKLHV